MNNSIYRFTLDIHKTKSQVSIPVLFHDTAIQFYISLTDGGKPYYIEDGCRAVFSAKKPDGTDLFNDCIIEDNTRIRYDFTKQTTNCEGIMNCEIRLYGTDGHLITTPAFVVVVDPRVIYDSDIIESHPESTALDTIISSELARLDAEADRVDAENARIAAEITRINEETERDDAEDERVAAEAERKANEAERMAAYASMIGSWVAYSLYPDGTDYTWEWSEGQRYIGLCNGKTPPKSKEDFVWSKFVDTGVYVGSGDMPEWCDLQIDPEGDVTEIVQTPGQSTSNMMSQKAVSDSFANALKGSASGELVALNDVSPLGHEMSVSVSGEVEDISAVTVSAMGKNLFDVNNASVTLSNGTYTQDGNSYTISSTNAGSYNGGSSGRLYINLPRKLKRLATKKDVVEYTVSFYVTLLEMGIHDATFFAFCRDETNETVTRGKSVEMKLGERVRVNFQLVNAGGSEIKDIVLYLNNNKILLELDTLQIEVGESVTEQEQYKGVTYPVAADGTVKGVTSIHPITTLLTDTAGAIIDCTYNKDANKAFDDIITRISALEAAVL